MTLSVETVDHRVTPRNLEFVPVKVGRATISDGPMKLGRYTLRYRIAQGAMASVYLAQLEGSAGFHKWVAVKVIHPDVAANPRFVGMFADEARLAAQIEHPNVCSLFDFGEVNGSWFIAMEYLAGETLGVVARTGWSTGRPPAHAMVARIVADAARGLHAAHETRLSSGEHAGVVHRDVSPDNVFVTYAGTTKIVDFGVARWKEQTAGPTAVGELKGKPAYMSPEQLREEPIDRRSDIWSLGVVLWEVSIGRRLFSRKTDAETIEAVLEQRIPHPRRFRAEYPVELAAIVCKALERDPDRRYQTALEFARELEQWVARSGEIAGSAEVGEYMQVAFASQIAQREPLMREPPRDAPRGLPAREISNVRRMTPIDPEEFDNSPLEFIPDMTAPSDNDMGEELTRLRPLGPSPASDGPPPMSLPPVTWSPLERPPVNVVVLERASLPAWRRRGVPSFVGALLLIVASLAVIAWWLSLGHVRAS